MSISKRVAPSGAVTWLARVFRERDPATGKQKMVTQSFRTQKEAKAWKAAILKDLNQGTYQEPSKVTLSEFFTEWLNKSAKIRLKVQTVELYERSFRLYIEPHLGKMVLQSLTPLAIQGAYAKLIQGPKAVAPQTVKNAHTALRSCLKQAVRWRQIPFNPTVDVDLPKRLGEQAKIRSFTPDQALAFLHACRHRRLGLVLMFALASGARPGEYLALLWSDIDWAAGTVRIERTIVWPKGGGWHFDTPKTRKSGRTISIPAEVLEELREHRIRQSEHKRFLGKDWKSSHDLVFTDTKGNAVYERHLTTRIFKPVLKDAGLPVDFRLYDLRHSCATLLLVANVPAKVVAERLGHASVTQTLDTYSHVLPALEHKATDELRNLLFPVASRPTGLAIACLTAGD
jgi:integrase